MSRINTNVVSLTAQRNLAVANRQFSTSLERLSTGLRINRGADNPAGLIASERLRSEKVALQSAISNNVRATNLLSTAEASLDEINGLLLGIQGFVDTAANSGGMTNAEIAANQLMVNEAITSITRIADTAQFNGKKLLDGSLGGYQVTDNEVAKIDSVQVSDATFAGASQQVTMAFGHAANVASKGYLVLDEQIDGAVAAAAGQVTFTGIKGSATLDFSTAGTYTAAQMADMINAVTDQTGVTAAEDTTDLIINSEEYGDQQYISVTLIGAAVFATEASIGGAAATSDFGTDAVIVGVDLGAVAGTDLSGVTVEGLTVTVNRANLQVVINMDETEATSVGAADESTFTITSGGGAKFQIGAEINSTNQITVAIQDVDAGSLGSTALLSTLATGGANQLSTSDLSTAAAVVSEAITTVSNLRGRLGSVQKNTLETQIRSLGTTLENITSAESIIRDTDFAEETANMTRAQILVQAGTSVLAMANAAPQNVLALLG